MAKDRPRVSIGLAVYNGERYLREAIDSILAQTFADFELIVSDNASTDGTAEICREYASRDDRVRLHRNDRNIGGANNENLTFKLARGEYFRWAAYDDVLAPDLLARTVAVLDAVPSVVLCHSQVVEIDQYGVPIRVTSQPRAQADRPHERFRELLYRDHDCAATYGLVRSAVLRRTRLQQNYTDSDRTLLCELSLYGKFYEIPEPLFYKRLHPRNQYIDWRARMAWFDPALKGQIVFPNWMQFCDYVTTIARVPLPPYSRLCCYGEMLRWLAKHGKYMAKDLLVAVCMLLHSPQWRRENAGPYNWE